ncbi:MAG TPA: low specificity L-threonine aldolase [Pyrinomonadaceae bacterium]|jgi:threonine aldolase|nr:low specificity L-threonine aldolase [Pyrinomonadaceae bacterium]
MKTQRGFASDNNAGVHPRVMEALLAANRGHVVAYGADPFTAAAEARFREHFGEGARAFFVFGGTGANVLGLQAVTRPYHAVVCAATSHINVDECGAPEKSCKLLPLANPDGKLTPALIEPLLSASGDQHRAQPRVVSVSQPTEVGTVYTLEELGELSEFAHARGMLLHVDGARLSNAAAHLGASLAEVTAGVDVLSFGGTKNGMMYGEAVVFFDEGLARGFEYVRKQGAQLPSKMRFIAAQFDAMLSDGVWLENARHANRMARLLAGELEGVPRVRITQPVESNAVFACLPPRCVKRVREEFFFYVWDEAASEVRLMCSFDTTEEDVRRLTRAVREALDG